MLHCNLKTPSARRYLDLLVVRDMVLVSGVSYRTTERGQLFVNRVQEVYLALFQ